MAFTIFGFIVTSPTSVAGSGSGVEVYGRVYKEYRLENYSAWLRKRVKDPHYWNAIRNCILGSKTCAQIVTWTPIDYLNKDMTPIQVIILFLNSFHIFVFVLVRIRVVEFG